MTNTFESIGTEAAGEILSWVKSAKDMLQEQAPLLVKEALELELVTSWIWLGIFISIFMIGMAFTIGLFRSKDLDEGEWGIPLCLLCVPTLIGIGIQVHDIMQVTIAPRTYVIEYLKDLI